MNVNSQTTPSPWAWDIWSKQGSFKQYKMGRLGLFVFLNSLVPNIAIDGTRKGYVKFDHMVTMATNKPQELHDFLFEVMNTLGQVHEKVKVDMREILALLQITINLSLPEIAVIESQVDDNFRIFRYREYQKENKISDEEMNKLRRCFFNSPPCN